MLFSTVSSWFASLLAASFAADESPAPPARAAHPAPLQFELRHLHAVSPDARVVFSDVHPADVRALAAATGDPTSYVLRPQRVRAHRPSSQDAFQRARVRSMRFGESELVDWDEVEVEGPDVGDRETLLELAKKAGRQWRTVRGVEVLLEQGYHQFHLWTGRNCPKEIVAERVLRAYSASP